METNSKSLIGKAASTIWWLVLLRGIAAIILGILFFTNPGATLIVIMTFLGAYWFVDGIFTLIASLHGKKENKNWGWGIFGRPAARSVGPTASSSPVPRPSPRSARPSNGPGCSSRGRPDGPKPNRNAGSGRFCSPPWNRGCWQP